MRESVLGVCELGRNHSVYLRRVKVAEALVVIDRGRPVAMLVPLSKPSTVLDRLIPTDMRCLAEAI